MPSPDIDAAVRVARDEMHRRGWDVRNLATATGLDAGTVGDFLGGTRWPRMSTRGRIEQALGLEPGDLERAALHLPAPQREAAPVAESARPVGLGLEDDLAGLTEEQIEAVRALIRTMKPPPEAP